VQPIAERGDLLARGQRPQLIGERRQVRAVDRPADGFWLATTSAAVP
jgi:hypothetical protein